MEDFMNQTMNFEQMINEKKEIIGEEMEMSQEVN